MKFRFIPELIDVDISANNHQEAIQRLGNLMVTQGYVHADYVDLVWKREQEYPTGLHTRGANIAMPHAFDERNTESHVALGILNTPVEFHDMEDTEEWLPVRILFMLAVGKAHEQLEMLQILMQIFKEEQLLKDIVQMKSRESICDKLNSYVENLS